MNDSRNSHALCFRYWGKARAPIEVDYCLSNGSDAEIAKRYEISLEKLKRRAAKNKWKKVKPGEKYSLYHLLPYHCLDVAAVGYRLLSPNKKLCQILSQKLNLTPEFFQYLFTFCLFLHDLGKFARAFQGLKENLSNKLVSKNPNMPYSERHDSLGFWLWLKVLKPELIKSPPPNFSNETSVEAALCNMDPWLEIVTGHHGMPPKKNIQRLQNYFEPEDELAALEFLRESLSILPKNFDFKPMLHKHLKKCLKVVSWQLAGISVLADWLGSDQKYFEYHSEPLDLKQYWETVALKKAKEVVQALPEKPSIKFFEKIDELFPFIKKPTPLQNYALRQPLYSGPQLFILEDVTGAGKTEAALILTHRLMSEGHADGFYVALPTMATSNAMYNRLAKVYRRFYQERYTPSLVLAHGARELSESFQESVVISEQLAMDSSYLDGYKEGEQELSATAYCNAWLADSRKKAMLADVGVGTLDQALLGVLPARHQSLRLLGLQGKVLLVDEVHAYDSYMQKLLDTLLEAHARQGGSAILLSATLPKNMRQNLVSAFHSGLDLPSPNLIKEGYPLVTHTPPTIDPETVVGTREEVKRTVKVVRLDSEEHAFDTIQNIMQSGQCVCWIRNTVKAARKSYKFLQTKNWVDKKKLSLFHSRFAMIDRQTIEQQTLKYFGEESTHEDRKGRILIATQVVEQSLDLDFDVLISDLAPIDLLIQRAGRLKRHIRDKNGNRLRDTGAEDQRGVPLLYLLSPQPEENVDVNWLVKQQPGTQNVYPHIGQLWLTANLITSEPQKFTMPDDARYLIEGVYSEETQNDIPKILLDASKNAIGKQLSNISIADLNILKLNKGYTRSSGDWDEEIRIPTRLNEEESISVALIHLVNDELKPYANGERYSWAQSVIKLPDYEWKTAREKIPPRYLPMIETLKKEVKTLRWLEVFPIAPETKSYYNAIDGWNPNEGESK